MERKQPYLVMNRIGGMVLCYASLVDPLPILSSCRLMGQDTARVPLVRILMRAGE